MSVLEWMGVFGTIGVAYLSFRVESLKRQRDAAMGKNREEMMRVITDALTRKHAQG